MLSIFVMQEAAIRSGKILLLPVTASLPSTLESFLSYHVFLCSFEEACQNVLQPTIKNIGFFQSYPVFQLFNCKNAESILAPKTFKFMHALISHPIFQGAGAEEMF